jgi:hypothetical protein
MGSAFSAGARFLVKKIATKQCHFSLFFGVLALIAGLSMPSLAQAQDIERVDRVKAAFVLNIARFVSWPADSHPYQSDTMQLCLYRDNPLRQAMTTIAGEEVGGRIIEIRRVQSLADSTSCSILLISPDQLPKFIGELPADFAKPMLTVADLTETNRPAESRRGILISLIRNGARIGFDINLERTRQTGLRMSSELLKLANIVTGNN